MRRRKYQYNYQLTKLIRSILTCTLLFSLWNQLYAVDYTSNGIGNWNQATTWTPNGTPTQGDNVTINSSHTVTITSNVEINNLIVDGGTLQTSSGSFSIKVYNDGEIRVENAGILTNSGFTLDISLEDTGGDYAITNDGGTLNFSNLSIEKLNTTLICSGTSAIILDGNISLKDDYQELRLETNLQLQNLIFDNDSCEVINTNGNTLSIANDMYVVSTLGKNDNMLTNESGAEISIAGDVRFENERFDIYNYGTITHGGIFDKCTDKDSIFNFAGATYNYGGATHDVDLVLITNYNNSSFNYNRNGSQNIINPVSGYYNLTLEGSNVSNVKTLGATDTIYGNLELSGNAELNMSSNDLMLKGNLTNGSSNAIDFSSSLVTLNGTGDQSISTNQSQITFSDLVVDKSAGSLILNDIVEITDSLTHTNGIIDASANKLYLSGSTYTEPASELDYIKGQFERYINTIGTFTFTVGNTHQQTFDISFTSLGGSGTRSLIAEFIASDPGNDGLPLSENNLVIGSAYDNGYWKITPRNGLSSTNYDISINAVGFSVDPLNANTRLLKRTTGNDWALDGTHVATDDTIVNRNGLSGINGTGTEFGIGLASCAYFMTQPSSPGGCPDTLFVQVSDDYSYDFQWYKDNVLIAGATDTFYVPLTSGQYFCNVEYATCGSENSDTVTIADVTNPTIDAITNKTVYTNNGCQYTVPDNSLDIVNASDNCSIVDTTCQLSGATTMAEISLRSLQDSTLNLGTTTVTWRVSDKLGNVFAQSFDVIVEDTTKPTIDPIADSTEYLDASCEFNLNDYTPLANVNDNCGSTSVTQNPPAGT
ncbi:MAG: G8 domain-containing protein, partial [Bacteroidales bacterium]|nr:G8 domain-containing protein [Bacteroidales bacterium]